MKPSVHEKTKAIIFDLDGTLVDTMPLHLEACQIVCRDYGFEFPVPFFYANAGKPTHVVFDLLVKELGLDLDGYLIGDLKENKFLEIVHKVKPFDYALEILNEYHTIIPISIGSGGLKNTVDLTLSATKLDKYFDVIVTCEDVENVKPAPDTFLKAAKLMNIEPEFCQVFEDGDPGLNAAQSAGMIATDVRPYLNSL